MESQEDRFIRQFMLIEDDRKERNFDHKSIERKQRIMPQGQIDLGIYPGEDNNEGPEEPAFYGFRMPIYEIDSSDLVISAYGSYDFIADENISDLDFTMNTQVSVNTENITINNSKIFSVLASDVNLQDYFGTGQSFQSYPATFKNCSFNLGQFSTNLKGSTFLNCDFSPLINDLLAYYQMGIFNKETIIQILESQFFFPENTYVGCSHTGTADIAELQD